MKENRCAECSRYISTNDWRELAVGRFRGEKWEVYRMSKEELLTFAFYVAVDSQFYHELIFDRLAKEKMIDFPLYNDGPSALQISSQHNNFKATKYLVGKGADVNKRDERGKNCLCLAVDFNNTEIAEFLLESGAEIDSLDNEGITPLGHACINGCLESAKLLIEKGQM